MAKPSTTVTPIVQTAEDRSDLVNEACSLAELLQWVAEAQKLIHGLRLVASVYPSVAERLAGLRYNSPELFDDAVSDALHYVHLRQIELIGQLGGGDA